MRKSLAVQALIAPIFLEDAALCVKRWQLGTGAVVAAPTASVLRPILWSQSENQSSHILTEGRRQVGDFRAITSPLFELERNLRDQSTK